MNNNKDSSNIMGERIKQKRLEHNFTMEELGAKVGVQPSAVNKWEKGLVRNIKRNTIGTLAEILECSPAWLMGIDEAPDSKFSIDNAKLVSKMRNDIEFSAFANKYFELPEDKRKEFLGTINNLIDILNFDILK